MGLRGRFDAPLYFKETAVKCCVLSTACARAPELALMNVYVRPYEPPPVRLRLRLGQPASPVVGCRMKNYRPFFSPLPCRSFHFDDGSSDNQNHFSSQAPQPTSMLIRPDKKSKCAFFSLHTAYHRKEATASTRLCRGGAIQLYFVTPPTKAPGSHSTFCRT